MSVKKVKWIIISDFLERLFWKWVFSFVIEYPEINWMSFMLGNMVGWGKLGWKVGLPDWIQGNWREFWNLLFWLIFSEILMEIYQKIWEIGNEKEKIKKLRLASGHSSHINTAHQTILIPDTLDPHQFPGCHKAWTDNQYKNLTGLNAHCTTRQKTDDQRQCHLKICTCQLQP